MVPFVFLLSDGEQEDFADMESAQHNMFYGIKDKNFRRDMTILNASKIVSETLNIAKYHKSIRRPIINDNNTFFRINEWTIVSLSLAMNSVSIIFLNPYYNRVHWIGSLPNINRINLLILLQWFKWLLMCTHPNLIW